MIARFSKEDVSEVRVWRDNLGVFAAAYSFDYIVFATEIRGREDWIEFMEELP